MTRKFPPAGLLVFSLFVLLFVGAVPHLAQNKSAVEPDFNDAVAASPAALRNGVGTYDQVMEFLGVDDSELHGAPIWEVVQEDLNFDGVKDLLISSHLNTGVAGHFYSVFIGSAKGYRYVGDFQGDIRTLPAEAGKPDRFLIASISGEGKMKVELAELQTTGLRRLAKAELVTYGCEAQDNPTFSAMICAEKISVETVKKIFSSKF